jgi:glutamate dehydrogenase
MEKTTAAYKAWLCAHMPAGFTADISSNEIDILAHTLVYQETFEDRVHLNFGNSHSLVLSLDHEQADEEILRHYGGTRLGIPEYKSYIADAVLAPFTRLLRVTRLGFAQVGQQEELIPMPENIAPALLAAAREQDSVQYRFFNQGNKTTFCFAWKNVQRRYFLCRLAAMFRRYKLRITGLRFSYNKPLSTECVLLGMIQLEGAIVNDAYLMHRVTREFELLKNFRGNDSLEGLVERGLITGNQANLLRAFTSLLGQILVDVDAALYTEENITEAFSSQLELTLDLLHAFEARFLPKKLDPAEYDRICALLSSKLASLDTGMKKIDDRRRMVFGQALSVIKHILRTNMYETHKLGIGFRLDPHYMDCVPGFDRTTKYPELPFGIYYIKGWNYFGFHIRFRDLARGGMRTVISWTHERELFERANMFSECYNLAFTQQKKNKDIPEGGSKSILFLAANEELEHEEELAAHELQLAGTAEGDVKAQLAKFRKEQQTEYMYYNQRCFLHTFLSLFIWDFEKDALKYGSQTVDYLKRVEYIYLGPDENFHDSMIQWLAKESVRMGYYSGGAFISGKEHAGVNHKEYGVTSWGALQYLNQGLPYVGIKEGPFTVKITGGPDGDVAGNFMVLLNKYYKDRAKVLVVTDGSGTGYDPAGFDLNELEKMFHAGMKGDMQLIDSYPREKLHAGGWLLSVKKTRQASQLVKECMIVTCAKDGVATEEWITFSAANKLYSSTAHTTVADVFLPCGGRPRALDMGNIETFLGKDGKPTSKLIVEGANLYLTQPAREYLEDRGVIIFKDSSANKCGVVSSSYEILAGLTMTDEQFMEVKAELAANILSRLELIANAEAKAMIAYHEAHKGKVRMSKIAEIVSERINKYTDEIAAHLKGVNLEDPAAKPFLDIFINYVPECISRKHLAQCLKRVPDMHKKCVIATRLACSLVYGKGLEWQPSVVDLLPLLLPQFK